MHEKTLLYGALAATALAAAFAVYHEHATPPRSALITPVTIVDASDKLADASPIQLTASDGSGIALVAMSASAVVEDPLALTELRLVFENPENRVREGTFRITLPQGASLSRFAMRIGDTWQEGEVVEKQAARRAYEDFLHRRQDPALMEQGGGNEFTARVFPIPARGKKELILTYAEVLPATAPYVLPLRGLPTLGTLDIDVEASGAAVAAFGIHKQRFTPGEDFVVSAKDLPRAAGVRSGELVVTRIVPFASSRPDPIASAIVLVDTSASRALGLADQAQLLRGVLAKLGDAAVSVAAFDQELAPLYQGRAAGFGDKEVKVLLDRGALGGSNLERAIDWASDEAKKTKAKRIVLITDGVATVGETDAQKLRAKVEPLRAAGVERIDAVAVGGIRDDGLLRTVVRGVLDKDGIVLDSKLGAETITRRLGEATTSGVPVAVQGATWSWPTTLDGLQTGDEVVVFAKMGAPASSGPVKITVGTQPMPPVDVRMIDRPIVERAVAQAEIQSLIEAPTKDAEATKRAIVALSTRHRVLSPHTALLVLETDQDYARFAIDRNARVDILAIRNGRVAVLQADRREPSRPDEPKKKADDSEAMARRGAARPSSPPSAPEPSPPGQAAAAPARGRAAGGASADDAVAAGLSAQADAMQQQMLQAFGGGSTVEGALGRSDVPPVDLAGAARAPSGVAPAPPPAEVAAPAAPAARAPSHGGDLRLGAGGGPAAGSGGGLSGIGGGSLGEGAGGANAVRGPQGVASVGATSAIGGAITNADRVIAGMRPRFRACYQRGLAQDPSMAGRVLVDVTVAKNGEVARATTLTNSGLSPAVAQCIEQALKNAQFDAPGGDVHLRVPVSFAQQQGSSPESTARRFEAPPKPPEAKPYDGPFKTVMELLAHGDKDGAASEARRWQSRASGDVMALVGLGEALEAKGDPHGAARAYGSILELFASRADSRRFAGERLERLRDPFALELAADTFGKAAEQRPDHPASHRLYAFTLLKAGQYERAFRAIVVGAKRTYPSGRFAGADRILKEDVGLIAAAWAKAEPKRAEEIARLREEAGGADESGPSMRFVLVWETDANDVDFHIYDGKGGHAYYGNRQLPSGGELYADVTTGYGPECFTIRVPPAERAYPYTLQAHYYSRGPMGYGMGKLQIITHDGRGGLKFDERPFVVMVDRAFVDLGTVELTKN